MKEIHRCVICDRVDHQELVIKDEGYYSGWYKPDKNTGGYICLECDQEVRNNLSDLRTRGHV